MDIRLALMCGTDIPVPELQITIHQPTLKEISYIGEKDFFTGVQCLAIDKKMFSQDNFLLENTSNFQIFMTVMSEQETRDKKEATLATLQLIFPKYKIVFTPRSILLNNESNSIMIDENNFDQLQEYFKQIFCLNAAMGDQATFNPGNKKAEEIAQKLMRGRQRVAAQKGGDTITSMFSQYISVLTVGLESMSIFDMMNLTMYQLYDLIERYMLYINWDIDIRSRLAGANPDKQPDNWMKNIH